MSLGAPDRIQLGVQFTMFATTRSFVRRHSADSNRHSTSPLFSRSYEKAGKQPPSQSVVNLQPASRIAIQVIDTRELGVLKACSQLFVVLQEHAVSGTRLNQFCFSGFAVYREPSSVVLQSLDSKNRRPAPTLPAQIKARLVMANYKRERDQHPIAVQLSTSRLDLGVRSCSSSSVSGMQRQRRSVAI